MIFLICLVSLVFSIYLPWYFQIALAAGVYSFRYESRLEILKLSGGIFVLHFLTSLVLDYGAGGLISERFTQLLSLPHPLLFHFLSALMPTLLFLSTAYLIILSRGFVKPRGKHAEKRV